MVNTKALKYLCLSIVVASPFAIAAPSPCEVCNTNAPIIDSANVGNAESFVEIAVRQNGQVQYSVNTLPGGTANLDVSGTFCPSASEVTRLTTKKVSETDMQTFTVAHQTPARVVGFGYGCENTPAPQKRDLQPSSGTLCPTPTCFSTFDPTRPNWLVRDFARADNGNQVRAIVHNNFLLNITIRNDDLKVTRQLLMCLDGSSRSTVFSDVTHLASEIIQGPAWISQNGALELNRVNVGCTSIYRTQPEDGADCNVDNLDLDNLPNSLPAHCRSFVPTRSTGNPIFEQQR